MTEKTVVLVGVGGYGRTYTDLLLHELDSGEYPVVGVVDPFAAQSPLYHRILEKEIPCYDTLEEFYREHTALLAVISTPIHLHRDMVITAMEQGSHVLCEKPLVPRLQDLPPIREAMARTGKQLSVGFQWSFSDVILKIKGDYLAGKYGKAVKLRSYTSWPRDYAYYSRGGGWAGKLRSKEGAYILDSIASNATAHYIHNMLFLLGDTLDSAAPLVWLKGGLYRVNAIDTFDTVAFTGKTGAGVPVYFYASHATNYNIDPTVIYEFEKAVVTINLFAPEGGVLVHYRDGRVEQMESPNRVGVRSKFLYTMGQITGENPAYCGIDTIVPHLSCVNGLLDFLPIHPFPEEWVVDTGEQKYVKGLHWDLWRCFEESCLPSQLGFPWAEPEQEADLSGYQAFSGELLGLRD